MTDPSNPKGRPIRFPIRNYSIGSSNMGVSRPRGEKGQLVYDLEVLSEMHDGGLFEDDVRRLKEEMGLEHRPYSPTYPVPSDEDEFDYWVHECVRAYVIANRLALIAKGVDVPSEYYGELREQTLKELDQAIADGTNHPAIPFWAYAPEEGDDTDSTTENNKETNNEDSEVKEEGGEAVPEGDNGDYSVGPCEDDYDSDFSPNGCIDEDDSWDELPSTENGVSSGDDGGCGVLRPSVREERDSCARSFGGFGKSSVCKAQQVASPEYVEKVLDLPEPKVFRPSVKKDSNGNPIRMISRDVFTTVDEHDFSKAQALDLEVLSYGRSVYPDFGSYPHEMVELISALMIHDRNRRERVGELVKEAENAGTAIPTEEELKDLAYISISAVLIQSVSSVQHKSDSASMAKLAVMNLIYRTRKHKIGFTCDRYQLGVYGEELYGKVESLLTDYDSASNRYLSVKSRIRVEKQKAQAQGVELKYGGPVVVQLGELEKALVTGYVLPRHTQTAATFISLVKETGLLIKPGVYSYIPTYKPKTRDYELFGGMQGLPDYMKDILCPNNLNLDLPNCHVNIVNNLRKLLPNSEEYDVLFEVLTTRVMGDITKEACKLISNAALNGMSSNLTRKSWDKEAQQYVDVDTTVGKMVKDGLITNEQYLKHVKPLLDLAKKLCRDLLAANYEAALDAFRISQEDYPDEDGNYAIQKVMARGLFALYNVEEQKTISKVTDELAKDGIQHINCHDGVFIAQEMTMEQAEKYIGTSGLIFKALKPRPDS